MDSYFKKIKSQLIKLGVKEDLIRKESDLVNDLGLSSVDLVDLAYTVESNYDIKIPEGEIGNLKTVNLLIEYIKSNVSPFLREH